MYFLIWSLIMFGLGVAIGHSVVPPKDFTVGNTHCSQPVQAADSTLLRERWSFTCVWEY